MKRWTNGQFRRHPQMAGIYMLLFTSLLATALWAYGEFRIPAQAVEEVMLSPVPVEAQKQPLVGEGSQVPPSPPAQGATENLDAVAPKEADNPRKLDLFIGEAVDEFFTNRAQRSEARMIMHCLAHRENGHAANDHCGDSGKACGPFQFHQPTWEGYRKLMIKDGKATEISDRYDLKESARTTAWALSTGRSLAWGPISRYAKGSNYAACQRPSWEGK